MHNFLLFLFALAGGLTLSGITANLYRLAAGNPQGLAATCVYYAVMVVAGPSVLLDNSTRSFRRKECGVAAYTFALGVAAYWSCMLGFGLGQVGLF